MMGSGSALPGGPLALAAQCLQLAPAAAVCARVHVLAVVDLVFCTWIALFGSPAPGTWIAPVQSPLVDNVFGPYFGVLAAG